MGEILPSYNFISIPKHKLKECDISPEKVISENPNWIFAKFYNDHKDWQDYECSFILVSLESVRDKSAELPFDAEEIIVSKKCPFLSELRDLDFINKNTLLV